MLPLSDKDTKYEYICQLFDGSTAAHAVRLYRIKKACRPQPARLRYYKGCLYKTFMLHMQEKPAFSCVR